MRKRKTHRIWTGGRGTPVAAPSSNLMNFYECFLFAHHSFNSIPLIHTKKCSRSSGQLLAPYRSRTHRGYLVVSKRKLHNYGLEAVSPGCFSAC